MSIHRYLSTAPLYTVTKYASRDNFEAECIAFEGAPKKHPYDPDKLLLVIEPFSNKTSFYEFCVKDIRHAENLPSMVTDTGSNLFMAKIWVVKGAVGIRYEPFEVGDTLNYYHDSELLHQGLAEQD